MDDGVSGAVTLHELPELHVPDGTLVLRRIVDKDEEFFCLLYRNSNSIDFDSLRNDAPRLAYFIWPLLAIMRKEGVDLRRLELMCRGLDVHLLLGSPNNGLSTNLTFDIAIIKTLPTAFFGCSREELRIRLALLRWYIHRHTWVQDARSRRMWDQIEIHEHKRKVRTYKCPDCHAMRSAKKVGMNTCSDSSCPSHYWWSFCVFPEEEEKEDTHKLAAIAGK